MKTVHIPVRERGMALVASLLMLVVITLLGVTMFRSYGLTERVAGNTREKERTLSAALSAQGYAEFYLNGQSGANALENKDCSTLGQAQTPSMTATMVCTNAITGSAAQVPWTNSYAYNVPGATFSTGGLGTFTQAPQFYITYLGQKKSSSGPTIVSTVFQVDAAAWGGAGNTVAVVESGYIVMTKWNPPTPASNAPSNYNNLQNYSLSNP